MNICRLILLLLFAGGVSAGAWADSESCYDMYPAESFEDEERNALIQECLALYAPEPQQDAPEPQQDNEQESASEPAYYEGTVEDFVNETPPE